MNLETKRVSAYIQHQMQVSLQLQSLGSFRVLGGVRRPTTSRVRRPWDDVAAKSNSSTNNHKGVLSHLTDLSQPQKQLMILFHFSLFLGHHVKLCFLGQKRSQWKIHSFDRGIPNSQCTLFKQMPSLQIKRPAFQTDAHLPNYSYINTTTITEH